MLMSEATLNMKYSYCDENVLCWGFLGSVLEMWCSCIFDSIYFSLFLSTAELLSLN